MVLLEKVADTDIFTERSLYNFLTSSVCSSSQQIRRYIRSSLYLITDGGQNSHLGTGQANTLLPWEPLRPQPACGSGIFQIFHSYVQPCLEPTQILHAWQGFRCCAGGEGTFQGKNLSPPHWYCSFSFNMLSCSLMKFYLASVDPTRYKHNINRISRVFFPMKMIWTPCSVLRIVIICSERKCRKSLTC